jgi:serine/threonine-protein kinase
MEVVFECNHCHATIEADSEISGVKAECPNCQEVVLVPAPGIDVGSEIGGFRVEKKLGVGGMGEVFAATQVAMDRQVALKILPPALTNDEKTVERFLQEVRMAAKLEHPNIVTAFDAGKASGYYYLAMSIVDGEDLSDRLKREKRLSEATSLVIVEKIAHALDYAWTKFHLLHRDIKPANIMITVDDEVKLMDMGIAKSLEEDSNLTMQGMLVGTPYYMSPEQATGSRDIDCRSDIYSLGATLYHLVTGKRPFNGPNAMSVIAKHLSETPLPPKDLNADLSDDCCKLIEKMMARDRMDRFETWQELRMAIARMRSGATLADVEAPTQISGGMIAPVAQAPTNDSTEFNLGMDDTIGLKGPDNTQLKSKPRLATTMEIQGSGGSAQVPESPGGAQSPMVPPPLDADEDFLEGGRDALDVKGVRSGMVMAAAIGVLLVAILVGVVYMIMRNVKDQEVETVVKQEKVKLEHREIEGEIASNIAGYKELEMDRGDLEEMLDVAKVFAKENPKEFDAAIRKFEKVQGYAEKLDLEKFSMLAEAEIEKIRGKRKKVIVEKDTRKRATAASQVMRRLTPMADHLGKGYQYAPAAYLLATYDGHLADETKEARISLANDYTKKHKKIDPLVTFIRKAFRMYASGDTVKLFQFLEEGKRSGAFNQDRQLMQENVMPLMAIMKDRFKDGGGRRGGRPDRRDGGRKIPLGPLGKAAVMYKNGDYSNAMRLARENRVTILRQVLIGEIYAAMLKGNWSSVKFAGDGYRGQVKKMDLSFDGAKAKTYYEGKLRGEGDLNVFGDWLYYNRGGKMRYWTVTSHRDGYLVLKIASDISVDLKRR